MRLLLTRPLEDAHSLADELERLGHSTLIEPLLTITLNPDAVGAVGGAAALIATSRHGLRALAESDQLEAAKALPLYAVGPETAALGRELGFRDVRAGNGNAKDLAAKIIAELKPGAEPLIHLAGDHLATDLAGEIEANGHIVEARPVYQSKAATAFSAACVKELSEHLIDGAILLSPRTAKVYADLMAAHGLLDVAAGLAHFCLSTAVAGPLQRLQPGEVLVAARPNLAEVLSLVKGRAAGRHLG